MSKTMLTRHKVSPKSQQELEEIGRKLFSWRPCHIKQMEEEAVCVCNSDAILLIWL